MREFFMWTCQVVGFFTILVFVLVLSGLVATAFREARRGVNTKHRHGTSINGVATKTKKTCGRCGGGLWGLP